MANLTLQSRTEEVAKSSNEITLKATTFVFQVEKSLNTKTVKRFNFVKNGILVNQLFFLYANGQFISGASERAKEILSSPFNVVL